MLLLSLERSSSTPGPPFTATAPFFRLRVRDWRVIYQIEDKTVAIRAIMLRRDAYKG